jgi:shikimate 5-dehydrogenase
MIYQLKAAIAFVEWSIEQGLRWSHDGPAKAIEQAGKAFYSWRGVRPNTARTASMSS